MIYDLKCYRLYEELESEVNFFFDLFVHKLAESIYCHFKTLASIQRLDACFKLKVGEDFHADIYHNVLKQNNIKVETINLDIRPYYQFKGRVFGLDESPF